MAKIQVTPAVVQWAMEQARITSHDVFRTTGLGEDVVEAILHDEHQPSKGDLDKIAKATGRSWHFFLLPEPPSPKERPTPSFRGRLDASHIEAELQAGAVREAHNLQRLARWSGAQPVRHFPKSSIQHPATAAATSLRKYLSWTLKDQRSRTKAQAFKTLRRKVEESGILVTLISAGESSCRGFSLHSEDPPLVVINTDFKGPAVRTFTLVHELAHLMLGPSDVLCDYGTSRDEVWCNSVAANFLLPTPDLLTYLDKQKLGRASESDLETVRRVSNYFSVSWHAAAIGLKKVGFADNATISHVKANPLLEVEDGFLPGGRSTPEIRVEKFGTALTSLLLNAQSSGKLPTHELSRVLHANSDEIAQMASLVRREVS